MIASLGTFKESLRCHLVLQARKHLALGSTKPLVNQIVKNAVNAVIGADDALIDCDSFAECVQYWSEPIKRRLCELVTEMDIDEAVKTILREVFCEGTIAAAGQEFQKDDFRPEWFTRQGRLLLFWDPMAPFLEQLALPRAA